MRFKYPPIFAVKKVGILLLGKMLSVAISDAPEERINHAQLNAFR